jgi:predicted dehydrogenase
MLKNILVKGYGSIGRRHVLNLLKLGYLPYVITRHPDSQPCRFIAESEILKHGIDYAIIATATAKHLKDLLFVAQHTNCKRFLIEKPLAANRKEAMKIKRFANKYKLDISVGYDMRFLNVFKLIKGCIKKHLNSIRIVKITAGQYLPEWRPDRDYRLSYSAHKALGGGVDLDLSHEIDYMLWCFGVPLRKIFTFRDKISSLEIDSCDYFKGSYKYNGFLVDLELDYIRKNERKLIILGENKSILEVDFIRKSIKMDDKPLPSGCFFDYANGFIEEMKEFLGIIQRKRIATLKDGLMVFNCL